MFKEAFEKFNWREHCKTTKDEDGKLNTVDNVDIIQWVKHTVFCHECQDRNWQMESAEDGTGHKDKDNDPNGFFFVRYCPCRKREFEGFLKREEEYAARQKQESINSLFRASEMGERFQERTFENFVKSKNPQVYELAKEYAENFTAYAKKGEGLFFSGEAGVGKTHLAGAIAQYLITKKYNTVIMLTLIEILGKIKETFKDKSKSEADITTPLKTCDLLIIDDFGQAQTFAKDWRNEKVFEIINYRYEHKKPIIITTNNVFDDIACIYNKAIHSRLIEICISVQVFGSDYRDKERR